MNGCCARPKPSSSKRSPYPILVGRPDVMESRLEKLWPVGAARQGFRRSSIPSNDPRFRDYVADLSRERRPARSHAQGRALAGADKFDRDRGDRGEAWRRRCYALRYRWALRFALALHQGHHRACSWRDRSFRAEPDDHQQGRIFSRRYPCPARSFRAGDRGNDVAVRRSRPPLRDRAENRSSCRIRISVRTMRLRPSRCAKRWKFCTSARPILKPMARCRQIPAFSQAMRDLVLPSSRLKGEANVLIMPNLDAANIAYTMMMIMADALLVGPILLGARQARPHPDSFRDGARHHQHDRRLGRPSARRWEALTRGPHVSPIQCPVCPARS